MVFLAAVPILQFAHPGLLSLHQPLSWVIEILRRRALDSLLGNETVSIPFTNFAFIPEGSIAKTLFAMFNLDII